MKNSRLKLDKSVFKSQSFEEADKASIFDKDVPIAERLRLAFELTCKIYGIKGNSKLKIDKSCFSAHKF